MSYFIKITLFSFFFLSSAYAICKSDDIINSCTERPAHFPEITIYNDFIYDVGCGAPVFCISLGFGLEKEINPLLFLGETQAWKKAKTPEQKAIILLDWIEEVKESQNTVVNDNTSYIFENSPVQNFDSIRNKIPEMEKPVISYGPNDQIAITLWLNTSRSTMRPVLHFQKISYTANKKGQITYNIQQAFTIDCWQNDQHICQITFQ